MSIPFDSIRTRLRDQARDINLFAAAVREINSNRALSQIGKNQQLDAVQQSIEQAVSATFDGIERDLASAERSAQGVFTPPKADPAAETLVATIAAQDIEARTDPAEWLDLYRQASEAGDMLRRAHLRRLIEPRMDITTKEGYDWELLKRELRTDKEILAEQELAGIDGMRQMLPAVRSELEGGIMNGGHGRDEDPFPSEQNFLAILDRMIANARQNMDLKAKIDGRDRAQREQARLEKIGAL